ncbi:hypothetical protein ETR_12148 [Erwinia tracheiphila PSU-1]|nr:hypothetical protein ETR_12148 [Erwinia tracheiphila PSU-1]
MVRRRGNMEPLIEKMKCQMLEFQEQESEGLLMLDKLSEHGVKSLINRN